MQNKPNLLNAQMNVCSAITMDYVNIRLRSRFKNKAKQSQFKANSNPIKANQSQNEPNTNPIKPNLKPPPACRGVASGEAGRSDSAILIFIILFFFVLLTVFQRL